MKQNDKEILLRDLSARIPYKVKCAYFDGKGNECEDILNAVIPNEERLLVGKCSIDYSDSDILGVIPYLFPLRSMTDEQKEELEKILGWGTSFDNINDWFYDTSGYSKIYLSTVLKAIEFFNRHHFDYNGLIEKSLALDATGLDIYN